MPEREVAKVIHYYDKIMVALLKLSDGLAVGDKVKFVYHDGEFTQPVNSMEVEHGKIGEAKAGSEVAVKVDQATHEGAKVYRVEG